MAFYVAGRAGAGPARCQQHRVDSRDRASIVTGEGERVLVIGDSWSVGLGQDDLAGRGPPSSRARCTSPASPARASAPAPAPAAGSPSTTARRPRSARPGLVVVEGGLNDYDQPAAAIDRGFRDLMADLAGQHGRRRRPGRPRPSRAGAVPRVDDLLASLSEQYGVPYVQTSDLDLDYLDDRLHLTGGGHERVRPRRRRADRRGFDPAPSRRTHALIDSPPTQRNPAQHRLSDSCAGSRSGRACSRVARTCSSRGD